MKTVVSPTWAIVRMLCSGLLVASLAAGCGSETLTVSAASSLSAAFREAAREFEKTGSARVSLNFAASGVLESQIRAGAPVSILATASAREPESLHQDGLVDVPVEFARNRLVVATRRGIAPLESLEQLEDRRFHSIAIGSPGTVPSGRYARQALISAGLWDRIESRLVPCENVRQVLAYLERGDVDAGLIYATDLRLSDESLDALAIADTLHEPIRYLVASVPGSGPGLAPHVFIRFLISEEGQSILQQHGFLSPAPDSSR